MPETLQIHAEHWTEDTDRYAFDFQRCHFRDGWAQCDTANDASYFGIWANPLQLADFSYVEGDCTLLTASNPEEFTAALLDMAASYTALGYGFKIDDMCQDRITEAFHELGLAELLH